MSRCGEMLHIRYRLLRQALAECLGTLILVVSGERSLSPDPHSPVPLFTGGSVFFKTALTPLPALIPRPQLDPFRSTLRP